MLTLNVPLIELYDHKEQQFTYLKPRTISMEHSLVSISKWESKWKKPFLENNSKTDEQAIDYMKCMTITQNVPDEVYINLPSSCIKEIKEYIDDPMTATIITENKKTGGRGSVTTSEIIYYWMIALEIPMECQKWHINRLLTLINVCRIKNDTKKPKMGKREQVSKNKALNRARKKKLQTRG